MAVEYRCSNCGRKYTIDEYLSLEKSSRVTDDPEDEYGVEAVCKCDKKMHSEKWQKVAEVDTDDGKVKVSTVGLNIGHGLDGNQWYETCIFHDYGSRVLERYETEEEAVKGHERIVFDLDDGRYTMKEKKMGLFLEEEH